MHEIQLYKSFDAPITNDSVFDFAPKGVVQTAQNAVFTIEVLREKIISYLPPFTTPSPSLIIPACELRYVSKAWRFSCLMQDRNNLVQLYKKINNDMLLSNLPKVPEDLSRVEQQNFITTIHKLQQTIASSLLKTVTARILEGHINGKKVVMHELADKLHLLVLPELINQKIFENPLIVDLFFKEAIRELAEFEGHGGNAYGKLCRIASLRGYGDAVYPVVSLLTKNPQQQVIMAAAIGDCEKILSLFKKYKGNFTQETFETCIIYLLDKQKFDTAYQLILINKSTDIRTACIEKIELKYTMQTLNIQEAFERIQSIENIDIIKIQINLTLAFFKRCKLEDTIWAFRYFSQQKECKLYLREEVFKNLFSSILQELCYADRIHSAYDFFDEVKNIFREDAQYLFETTQLLTHLSEELRSSLKTQFLEEFSPMEIKISQDFDPLRINICNCIKRRKFLDAFDLADGINKPVAKAYANMHIIMSLASSGESDDLNMSFKKTLSVGNPYSKDLLLKQHVLAFLKLGDFNQAKLAHTLISSSVIRSEAKF